MNNPKNTSSDDNVILKILKAFDRLQNVIEFIQN